MTDWPWGGERGEEHAAGFLAGVRWFVAIGRIRDGWALARIHCMLTVLSCTCVKCDQSRCSTPGS